MGVATLLLSAYELGHQPFALASALAHLEGAGHAVAVIDAAVDPVDDAAFDAASLVAISVPMHTALRLGVQIARRARARNPRAHVCMFGLYAWLNAEELLTGMADSVIGGEFEEALVSLAGALHVGGAPDVPGVTTARTLAASSRGAPELPVLGRLGFVTPRRDRLPPLERYARFVGPAPGETRLAGYVEASRGCLHRCRHCPITPVYDGRFFVVPADVVLADAEQQIAVGARHITFGDPDFLNGPRHSLDIARRLHEAHPEVTFDVTAKIEHLLQHRERLPELAALGCVFVVSAVEGLSERVLAALQKGHTREDVYEALRVVRGAGIALRPSLVPFTPWTTLDDYVDLVEFVFDEDLVGSVDPIQLAIRLLVPPRSALSTVLRSGKNADELAAHEGWLGEPQPGGFGHAWSHPDPRMDRLYGEVSALVAESAEAGIEDAVVVERIRHLAYGACGVEPPRRAAPAGRFVPKLSEPWFCCAEPNPQQIEQVARRGCAPPRTAAPATAASE